MDSLYNRVARRRRGGQRGFTLIELLVVIAVLAILAAIVIFNVAGVANKGKSTACQTDKQTVQTAVDAYYNDSGITTPAYPDAAHPGAPVANDPVNYTALQASGANSDGKVVGPWIHSTPPEQFHFTGVSGTIGTGADPC